MKLTNDEALGILIKERREAMRLTQDELGKHFNISKQTICNYEKGVRSMNASLFFDMCDYLRMKPNEVQEKVMEMTDEK